MVKQLGSSLGSGLKSRKTTASSVLLFVAALVTAIAHVLDGNSETVADWMLVAAEGAAAWGLLFSRDADKTDAESRAGAFYRNK